MSKEIHNNRQRTTFPVAVFACFLRDDKVLLMRRFNTGYEDGNYSLPAGHVDGEEPLTAALVREIREETGVEVQAADLKFCLLMHRLAEEERIDAFFIVKHWLGDPIIGEPHKCDHMDWFPLDQLPHNVIPYILEAITKILRNESYSEFGWND